MALVYGYCCNTCDVIVPAYIRNRGANICTDEMSVQEYVEYTGYADNCFFSDLDSDDCTVIVGVFVSDDYEPVCLTDLVYVRDTYGSEVDEVVSNLLKIDVPDNYDFFSVITNW